MPYLRLSTLSFYIAAIIFLKPTTAQHNAPLGPPSFASSFATATSGPAPSAVSLSPAALSSDAIPFAAIPTFTDSATSSTGITSSDPGNHSVLNFYFFFLALVLIAIAVIYWILRRKRKRRTENVARNRESALAADLERWPGDGRYRHDWRSGPRIGRWYGLRQTRVQEGFNERGEAPPAYVAKPEPTHPSPGGAPMPPEWTEMSGKPPDYEEMRHT